MKKRFKSNLSFSLALTFLASNVSYAAKIEDYSKLKHRLFVDSLRGGNHDESGVNDYYFTVQLTALRNTKDDIAVETEKRQQLTLDPVTFGEIQVPALTVWKPQGTKPEDVMFVPIDGAETIRNLVTKAMRTFAVREDEIAVMAIVKMYEKQKKFYFFGSDLEVGQTKYFPIPATQFQAAAQTNLKLNISDDLGTVVVLKVKYDETAAAPVSETPKK